VYDMANVSHVNHHRGGDSVTSWSSPKVLVQDAEKNKCTVQWAVGHKHLGAGLTNSSWRP
jgi:hypothetical protein